MTVIQIKNPERYKAVPDYYSVYLGHIKKYYKNGEENFRLLAYHYAKVAEEFGQAFIEYDDEVTCPDIYPINHGDFDV